jgi:uncharacterized protein
MNLKPITPSDYFELKPYFSNQRHLLCEYSLVSILTWYNEEYQPYGAIEDDSVVLSVEYHTKKENRHMMLPVSLSRQYNPEQLHALAEKAGYSSFWYIPGDYIKKYGKKRIESIFVLSEQAGYHDYIYSAEDLATLKGNKFSKKRNLIHQFKRRYLNNGKVTVEPISSGSKAECLEFLDKWCEERDCDMDSDENLSCEKQAVINTIEYMDAMEVDGLLLRIDREIGAFGMASRLTDDMGTFHFEKALVKIKGLYQYFDNLCAKDLFKDYTYINKESDMEVPGLAKAKKSYHPTMIVKSYRMDLK